ncbi:MotA/TolQ/ExbB proton channel family protein [Desulfobacca acetoxidans]|uniref:MotA/TolQ/ExbB proton channel n=1 Tax=Desulfobacca acetoxidans (strain ATCC 700848 / DSM 11109 / ASRB2) TaxID=880072 RepID=F2NK14_DESAR|nr:MotA/TolQ/ExbB proton channel family protein [Desulfobacca acetoxidans]AEB09958.1 MotA/TolQ/ExbB proton channel [Desulfobacca acetoxidans DSM 11109]HAY20854.1 MotA/TolQ/ExbB proton channel family protein [Desulfobacterales bacterium]
MLQYFIKGGPLMWPILLCSVIALAITINKSIQYFRVRRDIGRSLEAIQEHGSTYLAPVLQAVQQGLDDRQISLAGSRELKTLESGLGSLNLIAVIAPLLGLTGTVTGMIKAFQVIATMGTNVDPSLLAAGIWEALITTAAGLFVGIPTHVAAHYLDRSLDEVALRMKEIILDLRGGNND